MKPRREQTSTGASQSDGGRAVTSLLVRTAEALYRADAPWTAGKPYGQLAAGQRTHYEAMAAAALTVILGSNADEEVPSLVG